MADVGKKISQAEGHLLEAKKYLKTSFFKWKPDYDSAVSEYSKAATCFRNARAYDRAIETYKLCAESQKDMRAIFHAGKSLEQAGLLCKELKDFDQAADLIERASNLFLESGSPDTAALTLEKASKMVEASHPDRAVHLLLKAVDIVDGEDRPKQCGDFVRQAGRLLIRNKRHEEAIKMLRKEVDLYNQTDNPALVSKVVMGLVLLHLNMGDSVAADQSFQSALRDCSQFMETEEAGVLEKLLEAFDDGDQEAADQLTRLPVCKYLDNDFAKLARDLTVPGGRQKPQNNIPTDVATCQDSADEDDDEFSAGLC